MNKQMILALETSCDETSAAVVLNGRTILSNIISSQVPLHRRYGGVVPEIASRKHIEHVLPVVDQALVEANVTLNDLSGIGVTYGPGLVGALLVGVSVAKALAFALDLPLIGVNHLEGHIFANFLAHKELEPPFVALIVSGGHTALVHVKGYNSFKLLGQTRDDAAGEAFDKIARIMGLPYPGGPRIDALAKQGNPYAIDFPRAFHEKGNLEFSFSGLKSAVINYLHNSEQRKEEIQIPDVAASFQAAVVDVLVDKTLQAAELCKAENIVLAGGVAANSSLRAKLAAAAKQSNRKLYAPTPILCTDNGAMIACRAYYMYQERLFSDLALNAVPSLKLTSVENCNKTIVDTVNN